MFKQIWEKICSICEFINGALVVIGFAILIITFVFGKSYDTEGESDPYSFIDPYWYQQNCIE